MITSNTIMLKRIIDIAIYDIEQSRHCSLDNGVRGIRITAIWIRKAVSICQGAVARLLTKLHKRLDILSDMTNRSWDAVIDELAYIQRYLHSISVALS